MNAQYLSGLQAKHPRVLEIPPAGARVFCFLVLRGDEIVDLLQCLGLKTAILYFQSAEFLCRRAFQMEN